MSSRLSVFALGALSLSLIAGCPLGPDQTHYDIRFEEYVLEVELVGIETEDDEVLQGQPFIGRVQLDFAEGETASLQGDDPFLYSPHFQIVLPERFSRKSMKSLRIDADGFQPAIVDFNSVQVDTYTPEPRTVKAYNSCESRKVYDLDSHLSLIFALFARGFGSVAHAFSYEVSCGLSFRPRDRVKIDMVRTRG